MSMFRDIVAVLTMVAALALGSLAGSKSGETPEPSGVQEAAQEPDGSCGYPDPHG